MYPPSLATATWRKSSYSDHNGACVEIAIAYQLVGVRDSKNARAEHLTLSTAAWKGLVSAVRNQKF